MDHSTNGSNFFMTYIWKDFQFHHLHKCGGTKILNILKKITTSPFKGQSNKNDIHSGKSTHDRFTIMNIRKPHKYYVSAWAFNCTKRRPLGSLAQQHYDLFGCLGIYDSDPNDLKMWRLWMDMIRGLYGNMMTARIKYCSGGHPENVDKRS